MQTLRTRLARLYARPARGMTLLEIMIVLAIIALVMGLLVGPRVMRSFGDARKRTTRIKLEQYVNEAFPQWASNHPDKACPDKLEDLNEYMNSKDIKDGWGHPLKMLCGQGMPPGVKGLGVV